MRGILFYGRHTDTPVTNQASTHAISPKGALIQGFAERVKAMSFSRHEMMGLLVGVMVQAGLSCDEVRGGSTFAARR